MQNSKEVVLKDINGDIINLGDTVVAKNGKLRRNDKYVYTQDDKGLWLYKVDSKGNTHEDNTDNIRVDTGLELINEHDWIWIKEKK
jgi:hypothetical protein